MEGVIPAGRIEHLLHLRSAGRKKAGVHCPGTDGSFVVLEKPKENHVSCVPFNHRVDDRRR